ncbi:MAG: bifunctional 5,10-methylene-tetrahydrofolate dehydrogenase/5,10-methylene-tetrahydrofolate cyclohydrolase [Elusimicrobia bacterium RIFCSPLOWO2_01_FULL_59_12]|nr:MAG: bifunctional 5,10-methylene-tetrahydrofolate dehydrogenase/5,10-methylene-tetrahydrofolate cyclohydrolase [Elusimicrobia bacterium RIFCSPLOWO2_01_FULL_59_12]
MTTRILDGRLLSAEIRAEIRKDVEQFTKNTGYPPGLATLLVGDNPASHTYVANKIKSCKDVGVASFHYPLPASASQSTLKELIERLNRDPNVHAILLQLPLPGGLDSTPLLNAIDPWKDADGLHPVNLGSLFEYKNWREMIESGQPLSCTPHGVIQMLRRSNIQMAGRHAVVLGRSKLVGKPMAMMLLALDATVTICHSRTQDLPAACREADILVAAIGQPRFVKPSMVKEGAVVVDVGMNRAPEGGLCGDVDFEAVKLKTSAITPVPGGIGPMTVAMLLHNTLQLAKKQAA